MPISLSANVFHHSDSKWHNETCVRRRIWTICCDCRQAGFLAETLPQTLFSSSSQRSVTPLSAFSVYWDSQEWTRLSLTPSDSSVPAFTLLSYAALVKCVAYGGSCGRASNARQSQFIRQKRKGAIRQDFTQVHAGLHVTGSWHTFLTLTRVKIVPSASFFLFFFFFTNKLGQDLHKVEYVLHQLLQSHRPSPSKCFVCRHERDGERSRWLQRRTKKKTPRVGT